MRNDRFENFNRRRDIALKADTVGRMAVTGKEDFSKKVRRSMRELQNDARKIMSFFQKPSLKYAA
jgi:hypothetical protein